MFNLPKIKKGFTLIELLVVISVIAILAVIVLYGLNIAQTRARDVQRAAIMRAVQNGLQSYYTDKGVYPPSTAVWRTDLFPNFVSPNPCAGAPADRVLCPYMTNALTDPGCGGAGQQVDVRTLNAANCSGVLYTYATALTKCTAGGYELTLTKESGGTQTFCAPQ